MEIFLLIVIIVILVGIGPLVGFISWAIAILLVIWIICVIVSGVGSLFVESKEDEMKKLSAKQAALAARNKQAIKDYNEWLQGKVAQSEDKS